MGHQETEGYCRDLEEDKEMNIKFFFLTVGYQLILLSMLYRQWCSSSLAAAEVCFFFKKIKCCQACSMGTPNPKIHNKQTCNSWKQQPSHTCKSNYASVMQVHSYHDQRRTMGNSRTSLIVDLIIFNFTREEENSNLLLFLDISQQRKQCQSFNSGILKNKPKGTTTSPTVHKKSCIRMLYNQELQRKAMLTKQKKQLFNAANWYTTTTTHEKISSPIQQKIF